MLLSFPSKLAALTTLPVTVSSPMWLAGSAATLTLDAPTVRPSRSRTACTMASIWRLSEDILNRVSRWLVGNSHHAPADGRLFTLHQIGRAFAVAGHHNSVAAAC